VVHLTQPPTSSHNPNRRHSGNETYGNLAVGSAKHIAQLPAPLPGLAAQGINPVNGNFLGSYITWGGGSDSYFEYLIKYARLTNTDDETFVSTWKMAVESTIENLFVVRSITFTTSVVIDAAINCAALDDRRLALRS
jgi:hypothetical protein